MDKSTAISIFEKCDEEQIMRADKAVKQAMVYETTIGGIPTQEITFVGIKHLILQLSVKDNPLEILESTCDLFKDDPSDQKTWIWRAYKKFKNSNTGLESDGRSECEYLERKREYVNKKWTGKIIIGDYDPFAQRKADSKAERNAQRKQIPELVIKEFLKTVNINQVQNVDNKPRDPNQLCICPPEARVPSIEDYNGKLKCKNCNNFISSIVSDSIIAQRKQ